MVASDCSRPNLSFTVQRFLQTAAKQRQQLFINSEYPYPTDNNGGQIYKPKNNEYQDDGSLPLKSRQPMDYPLDTYRETYGDDADDDLFQSDQKLPYEDDSARGGQQQKKYKKSRGDDTTTDSQSRSQSSATEDGGDRYPMTKHKRQKSRE